MKLEWLTEDSREPTLAHLEAVGVLHERLDVHPDDFQPALDRLKAERAYVEQDIIELTPDTPNLDALCDKFKDEHLHTDDEVRFVLEGEGIFDLRTEGDVWMRATVERGDLIVVPADLHHRFFLTDLQQIRCVRLFKDSGGWVPHYRENAPD